MRSWANALLQLCAIMVLLAPAFGTAQANTSFTLTAPEREYLKAHPVIRVSNELDWPPYDFFEGGEPKGYSVDLMRLLVQKMGVKVEFVQKKNWTDLVDMLCAGKIDLLHPSDQPQNLKNCATFSAPIIKDTSQFVTRKDFRPVRDIYDLFGATIATPKGWEQTELLKKRLQGDKKVRFIETDSILEALEAVSNGRADATTDFSGVLNYYITKAGFANLKVQGIWSAEGKGNEFSSLHIATRKSAPLLQGIVNKALASITPGELQPLRAKWLSSSANAGVASQKSNSLRNIDLTPAELAYLKKHPKIRVQNETDYPPYDFAVNGQPQGYSIDLLRLLAPRIGIELEFVTGPTWAEFQKMHREGKIDLLHSLEHTPKRAAEGLFSEPVSRHKTMFVIRKGQPEIENFSQLQGKTVAVGKGWSQEEFMVKNHPSIKRLTVNSTEEMLEALSSGKADVTLESDRVVPYWLSKKSISDLKLSGWARDYDKGAPSSFYFYTAKNAPELLSMLNKALATLTPGELQELQTRWFGDSGTPTTPGKKRIELQPQEAEYLRGKGELRMCVDPDWMPFERIDPKGQHEGMAADFMKLVSERIGSVITLYPTSTWAQSLDAARERRCDVWSMVRTTPERLTYMLFTTPYVSFPLVMAARQEEPFVDRMETVLDKPIAVVKGFATVEIFRQRWPNIRIIEVANVLEGVRQVQEKKVYGFVDTLPTIVTALQTAAIVNVKIIGRFEDSFNFSVASRNDEPLLANVMQKAVDSISQEERQAIVNKWVAVRYEQGFDYVLFWKVVGGGGGVVVLVIGLILRWNRKLARVNRALDESQALLKTRTAELEAVLNYAPMGIMVVDGQRTIKALNPFAEQQLFHCERGAYIGQSTRILYVAQEDFENVGTNAYPTLAEGARIVEREGTFVRADGSTYLTHAIGTRLDPQDPEKGTIWLLQDVTEQRAAEQRLQKALAEQQMIFDNAAVGIMFATRRKIVRCNSRMASIFGYEPKELIGQSTRIFYASDEEYRQAGSAGLAPILAGQAYVHEMQIVHKNGSKVWVRATGRQVPQSKPGEDIIWIFEDVSAQRLAEMELAQTLNEMRIIFDTASIGICYSKDRQLIRINRALADLLGYETNELIGQSGRMVYASDEDYALGTRAFETRNEAGAFTFEAKMRRRDGSPVICMITGRLIKSANPEQGTIWTIQDVTAQRATEAVLAQTLGEMDAIFNTAKIGIALVKDRTPVRVNKMLTDMLGTTQTGLVGTPIRAFFFDDESYQDVGRGYALMRTGQSFTTETVLRRVDGGAVIVDAVGSFIDAREPDRGSIWTYRDVTDQRASERKLAQTLSELDVIFNNAGVGIEYSKGRQPMRVNQKFADMLGYSPEEILHHNPPYYPSEEIRSRVGEGYAVMLSGNEWSAEVPMLRKDGSTFLCLLKSSYVDVADLDKGSITTYQDVTELRRAQESAEAANESLRDANAALEQSAQTLQALSDLGRDIAASQEIDALFMALKSSLDKLLLARSLTVFRLDVTLKKLVSVYRLQEGVFWDGQIEIDLLDPIRKAAICARQQIEVVVDQFPEDYPQIPGTAQTASGMWVPLMRGDVLLGVMSVQSKQKDAFGPREQMIVRTLSAYGAVALANADAIATLRAAEKGLAQTLNELDVIFNTAKIGICFIKDRRPFRANKHLTDMLGVQQNELIGKDFRRFYFDEETFQSVGTAYSKMAETGQPFSLEGPMRRADGRLLMMDRVGCLVDVANPLAGSIWTYRDVTEQRAQEQKLAQTLGEIEIIFNRASIGMAFLKDRRPLRVNRKLAEMFGYTQEEMVRDAPLICPTQEVSDRVGEGFAVMRDGTTFSIEAPMQRKDGSIILCELMGCNVDASDPEKGSIWTYQDVTELRQAREAIEMANLGLRNANAELEQSAQTLNILSDLGREIASCQEAEAVFHALQNSVDKLLDAYYMAVIRLDSRAGVLATVYHVQNGVRLSEPFVFGLQDPVRNASRCARDRSEVVVNDIPDNAPMFAGTERSESSMFVPLMHGDQVLGVMTVQSKQKNAFGPREQMIVRTLSAYGAVALTNADAIAALREAEAKVAQTAEAFQQKSESLADLMDNCGQGIMAFGPSLIVTPDFSRACVEMLGASPAGQRVEDVLFPNNAQAACLLRDCATDSMETSDPDRQRMFLSLIPTEIQRGGTTLKVRYAPIDFGVLVVLTDVTQERALAEKVVRETRRMEMIVAAVTDSADFMGLVDEFRVFAMAGAGPWLNQGIASLYRTVHTFKGSFNQYGFQHVPLTLHQAESVLQPLLAHNLTPTAQDLDSCFAVDWLGLLDRDLNVVYRALGDDFLDRGGMLALPLDGARRLKQLGRELIALPALDDTQRIVAEELAQLGHVSVITELRGYERLSQQLAQRFGKELAPLVVSGDDVLLDPERFQTFLQTLGHVFRNAIDHGIEDPETRFDGGKPEAGEIVCEVRRDGCDLVLTVADDGTGIDEAALRRNALAQVGPAADSWSLAELVCAAGVSSRSSASEYSGRGVGLSAVRAEVLELRGSLEVASTQGKGTRFVFRIPLFIDQGEG